MSAGILVTLSHGTNLSEHYREVGKTPFGGRGICHTKAVLADRLLVLGSCNWTTSSRGNIETDVMIKIFESEIENVRKHFMLHTTVGETLMSAQRNDGRRGRSESPPRKYPMEDSTNIVDAVEIARCGANMPRFGPGYPYPWTRPQPKGSWF